MKSRNLLRIPVITFLLLFYIFVFIFNPPTNSDNELFLATTTSVENTGLLDYLIEIFEDQSQIDVGFTAVGSGAAIQLAKDGEVDAILVHAPNSEQELIDDGFVLNKTKLWFNFFIIIGPKEDPAGISTSINASEAFSKIKIAGEEGKAVFYSRGDESGTHVKEKLIWSKTVFNPSVPANWYFETGSGMSSTIVITNNDPFGYTLTDLGTFASQIESDSTLEIIELFSGDDLLFNPYSYLIIDPDKIGFSLNSKSAKEFLNFLLDSETNELVRNYKINDITLFNPIGDR